MVLTFNVMKKIFYLLLIAFLCSCEDPWTGCGPIIRRGNPEPVTRSIKDPYSNHWINIPTGKYYYPVVIRCDDGKERTFNVSEYDYWNADYICVE